MSTDEQILAGLKRKRGTIKASLTRVRTFVDNFDQSNQAVSLLEFRQEELPRINLRFDEVQCQIELINCDDIESNDLERDQFERDYFAIRSQMQEIISQEKTNSTVGHNLSYGNTSSANRVQLAPIPLPKFSGNIQEWSSFFDIFQAMVHNDDGYSPAQKMYYLRSCLEGPALNLVRSTPVCDGNYELVIQTLKQRYDNRSLMIQSHIRSILDCPYVDEATGDTVQKLYANITTQVAALKALQQPVEHWDAWLVTIIVSRLDKNSIHGWLLHQKNTELPKYSELERFLASRCVALEGSQAFSNKTGNAATTPKNKNNITKKGLLASNDRETKCVCCSGTHKLYTCNAFKELPVGERVTLVRNARLCFNCLSPSHMANVCKSTFNCRICKRRHHVLLHFEKSMDSVPLENKPLTSQEHDNSTAKENLNTSTSTSLFVGSEQGYVFLATAVVLASDTFGNMKKCRVVLDSGSQVNFISKQLANKLQLRAKRSNLPVSGIGESHVRATSYVEILLRSRVTDYQVKLVCYILPTIVSDLPSCEMPKGGWQIPDDLKSNLADPSFYKPTTIDLLIGGGIFFDVTACSTPRLPLNVKNVFLNSTRFGWIVTGQIGAVCLTGIKSVGESLEEEWIEMESGKDWDYGRLSKSNKRCLEEQETVKHFDDTAKRDEQGRFLLRLPLKPEVDSIGETLNMATMRFLSVERRLQKDEALRNAYIMFMEEYEKAGHMVKVANEEERQITKLFYLPHHPILKASSLTTKLRVVFDASAKSSTGIALNDVLMRGPTIQDELFSILLRFRKHQYVITADIEKMFRQIAIHPEDQDLQRIVWRPSPSVNLQSYRLTTVTYGTTSASFMATQCIAVLAEESKESYPEASSAIRHDFYMDDLMTGAETIEECISLQAQISSIFDAAKMPIRKWCSNSNKILASFQAIKREPLYIIRTEPDDIIKSLGLCWKPIRDQLGFNVVSIPTRVKMTKRMLLSDLNKIFDPLGFLAPVLIKGKIFLQQLWQLKVEWDKPLAEEIKFKWESFYQDLEELGSLHIPRKCKPKSSDKFELHGFCDASQEAYGACIYVRTKDCDGQWHSHLLCSRTRVAPLKGVTIPRLELCGALILMQLAKKVAEAWKVELTCLHFWTDSTVVLGWLNSQTRRLKTYVANRVEQILDITNVKQWKHVLTDQNPADVLSRGLSAIKLKESALWWNGPKWMLQEQQWPTEGHVLTNEDCLPEIREVKLVLATVDSSMQLINAYSDWNRLVRAAAWYAKFVEYLKSNRKTSPSQILTVQNLNAAKRGLLRRAQEDAFTKDILALYKGANVPHKSKIRSLCPFMEDGLILVGGRLQNSSLSKKQKHPIILPTNHHITYLIFVDCHKKMLHCGQQLLLAEIRRSYWPIKGRLMARSVIRRCVTCARAKPTFYEPIMAPLPRQRVQCARPFTVTGVDFAGPLLIRSGIRGKPCKKAWIAIFVCFATRAVHIEAVEDLTSSAFIATLRRFISRRGKPNTIWSDNGTNFVGAHRELAAYLEKIDHQVALEGISWSFNPPSAPHFGGLWESAVKSAKHHLTRVIKGVALSLGELQTLLCQIEACLNSRPLTPLTNDPNDLQPLTPAHFLIGSPMIFHPEPIIDETNLPHLKRWKLVQGTLQVFWKRWHAEYLPQLQIRNKWTTGSKPIAIDDVVIVKEDNTPPTKWNMARVTTIHQGRDGVARVATIQLANGTQIRRPMVKLCRLPVEGEELVEN